MSTKAPKRLGKRPPRVAFVVDWLEDSYQNALLEGAREVAEERGASLVAIPGGVIGAEHAHGARRNHLYDLIDPRYYDGLLILTGTLGNARAGDVRTVICPGFAQDKICSVAIELEGSGSVLIENAGGVIEAVEHLIETHGGKRIGFVRGPTTNEEAEARFFAYKSALEAHSLPLPEELIVQGDFRREAGTEAIRILLDERKIATSDIDALVAADDSMALAMMEELRRRKLKVPADIAVIGFDDVEEAKYSNPPLTSVRQPLREQGKTAMRAVLDVISATAQPKKQTLETTCSFRRSCGCVPEDSTHFSDRPTARRTMDLEASLIKRRELILADMSRAARGAFSGPGRGWEVRLFNALQDEFRGVPGSFRGAFDELLELVLSTGGDVSAGNAVISALRRQLTLSASNNPEHLGRIENLLHDARSLTSDIVERAEAQNRMAIRGQARLLADVCTALLASFSFEGLARSLSSELPRLGINAASVALYEDETRSKAETVAAFGPSGVFQRANPPELHEAARLFPSELDPREERHLLVIEPLSDEAGPLGFATLAMAPVDGYVYEVLGKVLATAVRAARLASEH